MTGIIITLWVLCAAFSAYIASQKNREPVAWFFVGLLFGLFALIAIASVPTLDAPQNDLLKRSQPIGLVCKHCGHVNSRDKSNCTECDRYLL